MPEGQEDHRFDGEELEHRFIWPQQVTGSKEKEEESIEGQADREIVDDGDVEVSSIHTAQGNRMKAFTLVRNLYSPYHIYLGRFCYGL